jgi:hypothetical protein
MPSKIQISNEESSEFLGDFLFVAIYKKFRQQLRIDTSGFNLLCWPNHPLKMNAEEP